MRIEIFMIYDFCVLVDRIPNIVHNKYLEIALYNISNGCIFDI